MFRYFIRYYLLFIEPRGGYKAQKDSSSFYLCSTFAFQTVLYMNLGKNQVPKLLAKALQPFFS